MNDVKDNPDTRGRIAKAFDFIEKHQTKIVVAELAVIGVLVINGKINSLRADINKVQADVDDVRRLVILSGDMVYDISCKVFEADNLLDA